MKTVITVRPGLRQSETAWPKLNLAWVLYFVAVFTIGRDPDYTQRVIWGGIVVLAVVMVATAFRSPFTIPEEVKFLWYFCFWCISGVFVATDVGLFLSHFTRILQFVVVVSVVAMCIRNSNSVIVWYWAFSGVAIWNVLTAYVHLAPYSVIAAISGSRVGGITENPNEFGLISFFGVLGSTVSLFFQRRRGSVLAWGSIFLISLYGVVASASRSALLATVVCLLGVPYLVKTRNRTGYFLVVGSCLVLWVMSGRADWLTKSQDFVVGRRMQAVVDGRDNSLEYRTQLMWSAIDIATANPITGAGLGQFGIVAKTESYAHSEWADLLSSTGVVGSLIYIGAFVATGIRLWKFSRTSSSERETYLARAAVIVVAVVLITGAVSWPHFKSTHSWFLVAIAFGTPVVEGSRSKSRGAYSKSRSR